MDYETLDTIADSYIPVLAGFSLLVMIATPFLKPPAWGKLLAVRIMLLVGLLTIAYGLMFVDNSYHFWPRLGLDYSTHTAVAFVLVIFLSRVIPTFIICWSVSLLLYAGLMVYQEYHSIGDIISTVLAVTILLMCMLTYDKAMTVITNKFVKNDDKNG